MGRGGVGFQALPIHPEQNQSVRILADLHIHSPFSRATSKELSLENLYLWAQKKGIGLVGTGDLTHPAWFREILEKLEPAEEGFWRLKAEFAALVESRVPEACKAQVRFVLQGEISTIYKKAGRTRKVHHLILLPDRKSAEKLVFRLERIGNLRSDGRPILGLDSRDLLELVLDCSEQSILIPAHIWTPWFSVFGSKSGFEDLEECYGELTKYITALETGLSSDPAMNWRCSRLDSYFLVSNSDAHSPSRLGREANRLDIPMCFSGLRRALLTGEGLLGTIEFFPEEGKYHLDGHRSCGVRLEVSETLARGGLCPSCGRPVTVGVLHRVEELADREAGFIPHGARPFQRLLPLEEVLGELMGSGPSSRKVQDLYQRLLVRWGPEIPLLSELPLEVLREASVAALAEALDRMRKGEVFLEAGFDGQYGVVRLFKPGEAACLGGQMSLAKDWDSTLRRKKNHPTPQVKEVALPWIPPQLESNKLDSEELDPDQLKVVLSPTRALLVIAGPGTGKTRALTYRLAFLLKSGKAKPHEVLAVTFTQRAASEMAERLSRLLGQNPIEAGLRVQTLHAYGLSLVRDYWERIRGGPGPIVADELTRLDALKKALETLGAREHLKSYASLLEKISRYKQGLMDKEPDRLSSQELARAYDQELGRQGAVDYDDLLVLPTQLLAKDEEVKEQVRSRIRCLFVDEFQDMNPKQLEFLRELITPQTQFTLIGDPDQSIYEFRGARPEQLLGLKNQVPDMEVLLLGANYRSTGTIVEAASALISHNPALFPRSVRPVRGPGPMIQVCLFDSAQAEAFFVAGEIDRLLGGTSHWAMRKQSPTAQPAESPLGFGDLAVLCRLHSLLPRLEEALAREGIPCERVTAIPQDSPMGLRKLLGTLRQMLGNIKEIPLAQGESGDEFSFALAGMINSKGKAGQILEALLERLSLDAKQDRLFMGPEESQLRRFLDSAKTWPGNFLEFLEHWILITEEDQPQPSGEKVPIMTVHAAKGLEFQVVFVVGCDEGVFPLRHEGAGCSLEEERRLFYVAMTRAKELLYLSGTKASGISTFLAELPRDKVSRIEPSPSPVRVPLQLSLFRKK